MAATGAGRSGAWFRSDGSGRPILTLRLAETKDACCVSAPPLCPTLFREASHLPCASLQPWKIGPGIAF